MGLEFQESPVPRLRSDLGREALEACESYDLRYADCEAMDMVEVLEKTPPRKTIIKEGKATNELLFKINRLDSQINRLETFLALNTSPSQCFTSVIALLHKRLTHRVRYYLKKLLGKHATHLLGGIRVPGVDELMYAKLLRVVSGPPQDEDEEWEEEPRGEAPSSTALQEALDNEVIKWNGWDGSESHEVVADSVLACAELDLLLSCPETVRVHSLRQRMVRYFNSEIKSERDQGSHPLDGFVSLGYTGNPGRYDKAEIPQRYGSSRKQLRMAVKVWDLLKADVQAQNLPYDMEEFQPLLVIEAPHFTSLLKSEFARLKEASKRKREVFESVHLQGVPRFQPDT